MLEFEFSSHGAGMIHAYRWEPEGQPRGVVQIIHGIAEYVPRYAGFAAFLNARGLLVTGEDHMGHGKSHGTEPCHFSGGWCAAVDDGLRAAVICGTGWQPARVLAAGLTLCGLEKLRLGETGRSKLLANLMFGAYNRKFPDARTPNDWICSDPEVVAKYTADPLCGQDATIGLTREMLRGIRMIQRPANLQRMDKALPVFFIAGRSDPVGNMGRGVEKAAAAFRAAGMQDVACKLYDGRHEILNEKDRQLVYDDVLAFYERHLD